MHFYGSKKDISLAVDWRTRDALLIFVWHLSLYHTAEEMSRYNTFSAPRYAFIQTKECKINTIYSLCECDMLSHDISAIRYIRCEDVKLICEFPRAEIYLLNHIPLRGTYRVKHIVSQIYRIRKANISRELHRGRNIRKTIFRTLNK